MLSRCGEIVQKWWDEIPVHFSNVETGTFVIMPNHVHGIMGMDLNSSVSTGKIAMSKSSTFCIDASIIMDKIMATPFRNKRACLPDNWMCCNDQKEQG
jgi:REP element-mobilizing transposase RayT